MDTLKQYIEKHKEAFEQEEPAAGHFERFKNKKRNKNFWSIATVSIAAAITGILAISAFIFLQYFQQQRQSDCENAVNMKICYLGKMQEVAANIDSLSKNLDLVTRYDLQTEVCSIIEDNEAFDKELPQELPDEQTKKILTAYYKDNLNSLLEIEQRLSNLN